MFAPATKKRPKFGAFPRFGRDGRNRTLTSGFGDRHSTFKLHPYTS